MASQIGRLLTELKRRRVYQVAVAYVVAGLGVLGAAELILDPLGLGDARPLIVILTLLGFPLALVLAWAYEVRPDESAAGVNTLRAGASSAVPQREESSADPTADPRKSIVVLPFDNMSPDPADAYFSDGLTEEVITQLAHLRSLRVISRASAMALKDTKKDVRTIGREPNVQYVMEGSVRKAGDSLRITAQLIDAGSDEHLWAETYVRELRDVFEIQAEIALEVADAMRASVDPEGAAKIRTRPTDSLDAHDAYLLARQHWRSGTEQGFQKAEAYFKRAIELDPGYARARAGLAYCYATLAGNLSLLPVEQAVSRARAEAHRAIELDPDLGDAHGTLAIVEAWYFWEWDEALRSARLGVERDPNSYIAWHALANVLSALGKHEECLRAVDRYVELDPLEVQTLGYAAFHYSNAGRFDEAMEFAKRCEETDPGFWGPVSVAVIHQYLGSHDEALRHLVAAQDKWDGIRDSNGAQILAYALGRAGRLAEFEAAVAHLVRRAEEGTATWTEVALAYMGVNDHERALTYLEKAPEQRPPGGTFTAYVGVLPSFEPIRDHPRFQQVLKRLGLPSENPTL